MTSQDKNMLIERYAKGREHSLMESYILEGPSFLCEKIGLSADQWKLVFDYLVFNFDLLRQTIKVSTEFFMDAYIKHGTAHVRAILEVEDSGYDEVWERCFDFIALANDALYYHVIEHRERYLSVFKARGGDFVRKVLGIWNGKYEENWQKILEFLLHNSFESTLTEKAFENGINVFVNLAKDGRLHRPVEKSEMFRTGLV